MGGLLAAPFFPASISSPHVLCVLFLIGWRGFSSLWEHPQGRKGHLCWDPA